MHMPVTVRFIDYAFNENIPKYYFHKWVVFLIYLFLSQTQKLSNKSLLNLEKKRNFCLCDSQQNLLCCLHDQSHWQTDLPACLPA